jgi:hypothetical protein
MNHAVFSRPLRRVVALTLTLATGACFIYRTVGVESIVAPAAPAKAVHVASAVKAHLSDGTTVVFRDGVTIDQGTVRGDGLAYDLLLNGKGGISTIPLSSVVAMENFQTGVNPVASFAISTLATVGVIGLSVAIYCASNPKCFGSCPTAYSDSAGTSVLEAEGFSYAIAPLFEMRDVDRLRTPAGPDGAVRLEIRDEALETHYINQLQLLEVRHAPDEFVAPDPRGNPIVVRGLHAPFAATDRAGRNVLAALEAHDGVVFRTDSATLAGASARDAEDWIDLDLPAPPQGDSAVLVLRLRNSLLTTVLLYDLMLADHGARALDYMAENLQHIGSATELGRWYAGAMGMRVSVWDGSAWRQSGRFLDTGPIAWKELAVMIPNPTGGPLRVRLSFPADDWRIDRVAVARTAHRATPRTIPLAAVIRSDGRPDSAALVNLREADERYLETTAGQRFDAVFQTGAEPADSARTFLLAWQGFYYEWIRRGWLERGHDSTAFRPGAAALAEAQRRWRESQGPMEVQFGRTRVPVR